jgi:hypothetical protein
MPLIYALTDAAACRIGLWDCSLDQIDAGPKTQFSVSDSEVLCYAVRKCGEFFAGPQDFCCWSSSLRPTRRWRWPVLRSREPCTACATRSPSIHGSPCHAIIRWQSRMRHSPNRPKSDHPPKLRFKTATTITAARTTVAAALPPPSGRDPLSTCSAS